MKAALVTPPPPPVMLRPLPEHGLVTRSTVLQHVHVSTATLNRWMKQGQFPLPIARTGNLTLWGASAIRQWIAECEAHGLPRPVTQRPTLRRVSA